MTPDDLATRLGRLGFTQTEAARRLGITQPELSRWITGRVPITKRRAAWLDEKLRHFEQSQEPSRVTPAPGGAIAGGD